MATTIEKRRVRSERVDTLTGKITGQTGVAVPIGIDARDILSVIVQTKEGVPVRKVTINADKTAAQSISITPTDTGAYPELDFSVTYERGSGASLVITTAGVTPTTTTTSTTTAAPTTTTTTTTAAPTTTTTTTTPH